jgi:hypothetical protein
MQNLQTNEALLQHFQVEELEERLENCWQGMEWQDHGYYDNNMNYHEQQVQVPCGTVNNNDPYRHTDQAGPGN